MNNLSEKTCPLINRLCTGVACTFFNQMLDGCEISIMNYNLYQLKQHIRSLLNERIMKSSGPAAIDPGPVSPNFPRPTQ